MIVFTDDIERKAFCWLALMWAALVVFFGIFLLYAYNRAEAIPIKFYWNQSQDELLLGYRIHVGYAPGVYDAPESPIIIPLKALKDPNFPTYTLDIPLGKMRSYAVSMYTAFYESAPCRGIVVTKLPGPYSEVLTVHFKGPQ
jgi:hypothetical protein